jgi:hypothetical protein
MTCPDCKARMISCVKRSIEGLPYYRYWCMICGWKWMEEKRLIMDWCFIFGGVLGIWLGVILTGWTFWWWLR